MATTAGVPEQSALQKQQDDALMLVQEMLADSNTKIGAYTSQLQSAGVESSRLAEVQKGAITTAANSAVVIESQTQNAELWAQNTANAIYETAGGEVAQVAQIQRFNDLSSELQSLQDQKKQLMNQQPTGIWLFDQIANSIDSLDVDKNIKLVSEQVNTTAQLAQMSGQMQEGYARVNSLNKQVVTLDTIDSNNNKIRAAADQERAQIDMQKLAFNSDNLKAQMQAQNMQVQNVLTGVDVSMKLEDQKARRQQQDLEQQRIALQAQEQELRKEQMVQQREEWALKKDVIPLQYEALKLELQDKIDMAPAVRKAKLAELAKYEEDLAKQKNFEDHVVKSVRAAQMVMETTMEPPEVILQKYANPSTRDRYIKLQEMGDRPDKVNFGATPADAAETMAVLDPYGAMGDSPAAKLHSSISDAVVSQMQANPDTAPRNKDQQVSYYNTVAKGYMLTKSKKIEAGDGTNPYQAPPLPVIVEHSPKVQNSPLFKNVLKPYNLQETNPQKIAELAASGVKAKVITPEEAAQGLVDIFTSAAIYNNTFQGGFERAGLKEFEQRSYNTAIKIKPTFGNVMQASDLGLMNSLLTSTVNPLESIYEAGSKAGKEVSKVRRAGVIGQPVDLMKYSDALLVMTKLLASDVPDLPNPTTSPATGSNKGSNQ